MAASVRDKQIAAIKRMLCLNLAATTTMTTKLASNTSSSSSVEPVWKILIYDRCGQDIISPLVSVKELRELGITLHLSVPLLHSNRDPIPDVPAIYFIMPTDENIQRISQDFRDQLYDSYYLNFVSAISRQKLEDLAGAALHTGCVSNINKVFDQYQNFIALDDDVFILRHQKSESMSYYAINRGEVKDTEMESIMDSIVDGLFSVFVTLGNVPIIRCPKGNAAEMVAERLDKKLRENLRDARNSLFTCDPSQSASFSFQRPLLVILDRNVDLATPLHHTWTYQALAHDVLDLSLNRLKVDEEMEKSSPGHGGARHKVKKTKTFDMGPKDAFWATHKGSPFPTVAEAVQEKLESYRNEEEEIKRLKVAMGLDAEIDETIGLLDDNTARLSSAVSSLPELMEKKRLIDVHTTIATAILEHIKARKLDVYFELEEKIMGKVALDKSIVEIITDPDAGTAEDKMRLFLIYYICYTGMSDVELDQYSVALNDAGCDLAPLHYLKRWKAYTKITIAPNHYTGGGTSTKTISMFSKLMSQGSQFVMEGVKNLVVKKHNLPVTRIVDALMELKSMQETDDYRYLDPKLLRASDQNQIPRNRYPFHEAIVFIVGGGNYIEYQNLIDYAKSKTTGTARKIVYGCTDLQNASQFINQLCKLGADVH